MHRNLLALALAAGLTTACSDTPTGVGPATDVQPAFAKGSPNTPALTGRLAFSRGGPGGYDYDKLWIANPDGTGLRQLTTDEDATAQNPNLRNDDGSAVWSPDGAVIAVERKVFDVTDPGATEPAHLQLVYADGSLGPALLKGKGYDGIVTPDWSPDGTVIAATLSTPGLQTAGISLVSAQGGAPVALTDGTQGLDVHPAFSPDGQKIAFVRKVAGSNTMRLMTMNRDGSGVAELVMANRDFSAVYEPEWSPDGRRLAFSAVRTANNATEVYSVLMNGSKLTRLTNYGSTVRRPSFSPDGKSIQFTLFGALPAPGIYVMNADGTNPRLVVTSPNGVRSSDADWSTR
jgi:Tol biopolymer transport system component